MYSGKQTLIHWSSAAGRNAALPVITPELLLAVKTGNGAGEVQPE